MTNTQLYLAIGIPSLLVFLNTGLVLGFLGNLSTQIKDLRAETRADALETRGRVDRIAQMFTDVHLAQGRHDARLDALERERKG